MQVEKSSRRSCSTQTPCWGEDLGEDSQMEYLSAYEEYEEEKNNSSEFSEQGEKAEVKDVPPVGDKVPPQMAAGEEESGKSDGAAQGTAAEPDVPFLPPGEEAAVCARGTSGADSTAGDAECQLPVPETLPGQSPGCGTEAAEEPSAAEPERGEAPGSVAGVSEAAQAVDAGPAFPPGRSSSAQLCLCSRAVNTELTMMSKARLVAWLGQTSVDAASNTEWSFGAQRSQESKDHLRISGWKTGADRPDQPNEQTGKECASGCCRSVLQRACEAELQLLAIQYEMCYQHCLKAHRLALEENTCFGRCEEKSELHSSLLLVLDELDNNYSNMKREISMGIPLNELPPLSVELKFAPISSFYTPSKFFRKSFYSEQIRDRACSGTTSSDFLDLSGEGKADLEEAKQQEKGISDKSQRDGGHPGGSASPETWEGQPKDQALERGCVRNEEGSEHWFDAKEDLSVADISVMCKETKKQRGKQDSIDSGAGNFLPLQGSFHLLPSALKSPAQEWACSLLGDDEKDPGENSLQKTSTCPSVNPPGIFVSPYALNLSSFTKLIKRLQEKHPECSRDEIVEAVQEVRKMNKGVLSGLAISSIEEKTSVVLRRSMGCAGQEKH